MLAPTPALTADISGAPTTLVTVYLGLGLWLGGGDVMGPHLAPNPAMAAESETGDWGCYRIGAEGDLVLRRYPETWIAPAPRGDQVRAAEPSILGRFGYFTIGQAGAIDLEPFPDDAWREVERWCGTVPPPGRRDDLAGPSDR